MDRFDNLNESEYVLYSKLKNSAIGEIEINGEVMIEKIDILGLLPLRSFAHKKGTAVHKQTSSINGETNHHKLSVQHKKLFFLN